MLNSTQSALILVEPMSAASAVDTTLVLDLHTDSSLVSLVYYEHLPGLRYAATVSMR